jgi:hypothetical protein
MDPEAILACALRRWQPGIGDPTPGGWLAVCGYAVAALGAFVVAARPLPPRHRRIERSFWLGAGLLLVFLAANKQLDLQSLVTAAGRCVAVAQDWYAARRTVQVAAIVALAAACVSAGILVAWRLRPTLARTGPALLGLVLIAAFVLVRAVGFHHVDALIGWRLGGGRSNAVLELGGIFLFAVGTAWALARGRR